MSPAPQTTPIDGALVVPLTKHEDSRGWFLEARKESWFRELGGKPSLQTNIVYSRQGVIRGLHFHELGQDDLFYCAQGMVRVVLFDRREKSPTTSAKRRPASACRVTGSALRNVPVVALRITVARAAASGT